MKKKKISLGEFYVNYYEEYKPKQVQWAEYNKWRSKIVYVVIISIILAIIFYLHNK